MVKIQYGGGSPKLLSILLKFCHTFCFMNRKKMKLGRNDRIKNLKIMGRLMHPNRHASVQGSSSSIISSLHCISTFCSRTFNCKRDQGQSNGKYSWWLG